MLRKLVGGVIKFRFVLLLISIALTSFFIYKITSLKLYDDPNQWPPKDHPNVVLNNFIQENFGGANNVTIQISVKNGDIFNTETLSKVKRISDKLDLIWGSIPYNLYSLSVIRVKYMRATEELYDISPLIDQVPTTPKQMERLKWGVYHNPMIYGVLVSPDAKATMIRTDFRTGENTLGLPATDPITIYKEIKEIIDPENDENHTVRCTGSPIIIGWVNSDALTYMGLAFALFVAVVVAVLWFAFRNIQGVSIAIILGLVASIWAFGLKIVIGGEILRSASAFIAPFIIVAAAACHHVQFLKRFFDEEYPRVKDAPLAIVNTFTPLLFPLIISLLTDLAAFVVCAFIPFDNVSALGLLTALGLFAIVFNVFFLQIPLISYFHGRPKELKAMREKVVSVGIMEKYINKVVELLVERRKPGWVIISIMGVIIISSVLILPQIKTGQNNTFAVHNFLTRSWENNPIYLMEMDIKKRFKGVYPLTILIETKEDEGLKSPQVLKEIDAFAKYLENIPHVAGTMHLPTYMKLMHRFFWGGKDKYYVIPDDEKSIGIYLNWYSMDEPGVFNSVVNETYQSALLTAYVENTGRETVKEVMQAARDYAHNHFNSRDGSLVAKVGGGDVAITDTFNASILKWLFWATILSTLASMVIVLILVRSLVAPFFLILPLGIAIIIWLAVMYLSGIEMNSNITTSMAMATGVGIDAELYFLYRFREEYASSKDFKQSLITGFTKIRQALIFSNFSLILGCWALIPIPLYVGYVGFAMGMILFITFMCSFTISPFMWSLVKPKFLCKGIE